MRHCLLLLSLFICNLAKGQGRVVTDMQSLYSRVINALAADSMRGRLAGTEDEKRAGDFVVKEFRTIKRFHPDFQVFSYRTGDKGSETSGRNIYCYIDNHADSTILLGAHYDHVGMGGPMSKSYGKTGVHPGADDNASGVALLLGLACRFDIWKMKTYNYLFVSYSAHEVGLYGSSAFYTYCRTHFSPICRMLNFDMVGRLDNQLKIITIYANHETSTLKAVAFALDSALIVLADEPERIVQTDCRAFAKVGVECISFTTGTHEDYHKITDDPSKINYEGIWVMQQLVETILRAK